MKWAESEITFSALLELYERADVFDNVGRVADLLYLIVGDSHVKNLAKTEVRNKEGLERWNHQDAKSPRKIGYIYLTKRNRAFAARILFQSGAKKD
jgi:hypothetical protein